MITQSLLPQHLADLRRSGLSDRTIREAGLYSLTDPARVRRALNWSGADGRDRATALGPCLAFPFHTLTGQVLANYLRLRPDNPRRDPIKDRANKYESPAGQ